MSIESPQVKDQRRSTLVSAGIGTVAFTAVLWAIQLLNALDDQDLDRFGVQSRTWQGLRGIVFAPLLHAGWGHLLSNTVPVLVLGFLVLATGVSVGVQATAVVWLVAGIGVWALGPAHSVEIGASVLVFGWLVYLVVRGVFTRRVGEILLGVGLLIVFGGVLLGVLPGTPGVSWQGHLFGAVGGALAAFLVTDRPGESDSP